MTPETLDLSAFIEGLRNGTLTPQAAEAKLRLHVTNPNILASDEFTIDLDRENRTGIPEVIFAARKSTEQLKAILTALVTTGKKNVLLTRVSPACYDTLKPLEQSLNLKFVYHPIGQLLYTETFTAEQLRNHPTRPDCTAAVITAGSSDLEVAEEAALTLQCMGTQVNRIYDVGVAGINRLLNRLATIRSAQVAIVIAGMDGVLPSVLGGLIDRPVIAVPSSVGYGAHFGGIAPLLTMLNSCAPGVAVVNIDNGFGAAILALKIFKTFR